MNLVEFLVNQEEFSLKTFGTGFRYKGILDHIEKEIAEIRRDPHDVMEWIDIVILALDGALRAGNTPSEVAAALQAKFDINRGRKWPPVTNDDKAIEHIRD